MTLAICVATPEGLVMAGESRQTYLGRAGARVGSDSAAKVFELTDTITAATSGWAFLRPQGAATLRNVSSLVEEFKVSIPAGATVQTIANDLVTNFSTAYQWHTAQGHDQPVPAGQSALQFLVAGYDPGARVGTVYDCRVPGGVSPLRDTNNPGASWIGQGDVVSRIIKGWDPRLSGLGIVPPANTPQLNGLEYVIQWHTMTLQDAIDFATSMIQITISVQRFADGIQSQPGDIPGVGGAIDVAVVRPGGRITWIRKKELHF
jgi:hypothetical protein